MQIYLEEKIGNPELFTGRKKELALFLGWIRNIKKKLSMSTAILARRKSGKTALLQRLFNLTFEQNDGVIPFYYEVREGKQTAIDFSVDFFLTFLYQYIAFKTRKSVYLHSIKKNTFASAVNTARQEGLEYLIELIEGVWQLAEEKRVDRLWATVRDAPRGVAEHRGELIVQMIDEFQYLNSEIYRDDATTIVADDFAAGYMSTAEYRIAPLLISGSWVGWLRDILHTMLPSRFRQYILENMPEDESVEMIYNYARLYEIPLSEEVVYSMAQVCEGSPFYVSALFQSYYPGFDLCSEEGMLATLEYETLNERGTIRLVWMEYIGKVFYKVNQQNAKRLVLYLCQQRKREIGRDELRQKLALMMSDDELQEKLHALVKSDIVEQGRSNFYYRGVQDNIFDKVFRGIYADDIAVFDPQEITNEYKALYKAAKTEYRKLLGSYNQRKGLLAEFLIINQLRLHAHQKQELFRSITHNLPPDFQFVEYMQVWSYKTARPDKQDIWIDIFARAGEEHYSLIGEVKNRSTKVFSKAEAEEFARKAQTLQQYEEPGKSMLFVFSRKGFTNDALTYFQEQGIAYSDDERWLGA
ncbi:MAG: hypothetical protein GY801_49110 [bacterium]|nr:hypothetical protein [bacterium]